MNAVFNEIISIKLETTLGDVLKLMPSTYIVISKNSEILLEGYARNMIRYLNSEMKEMQIQRINIDDKCNAHIALKKEF